MLWRAEAAGLFGAELSHLECFGSMQIKDLAAPVTTAKADWLVASHWIGFTPASASPDAHAQRQASVAKQFGEGYVLEYIMKAFDTPNPGFEHDPSYLEEREAHKLIAGCLVAVHRLRPTARPLKAIIGEADYNRMQDMWAEPGNRLRWSVAFPIVESYEIVGHPRASQVFSTPAMQRIFHHPSAVLRNLNDQDREALAGLEIQPRTARNAWIAIEDQIAAAELSTIDPNILRNVWTDVRADAPEGFTEMQWQAVRRRAAWLAQRFVRERQKSGTLKCDECPFDPVARTVGTTIRPRTLLDVHHLRPLEEGVRVTSLKDFSLLCPTCHRFAHAVLRQRSES